MVEAEGPAIIGVAEASKPKNTTNYTAPIAVKSRAPAGGMSPGRAAGVTVLRMSPTAKRSQKEVMKT